MDPVGAENLSREEILNVLQQRHLYINDMHTLTHVELVRIYKTFVLPLSRRVQKHKYLAHQGDRCLGLNSDEHDKMLRAEEGNIDRISMDIDLPSVHSDNSKVTSSIISNPIAEKRRPIDDALTGDYQYHLSKATKRIRIDASF